MSVTVKAAWIGAGAIVFAAIVAGVFQLYGNKPDNNRSNVESKDDGISINNSSNVQISRVVKSKDNSSSQELILIIQSRAKDVIKQLDIEIKEMDRLALKASQNLNLEFDNSLPRGNYHDVMKVTWDITNALKILKQEFVRLHGEYVKALENSRLVLAHELNTKIQKLLMSDHRDIYYDAGVVASEPGFFYANGWKEIRVGSEGVIGIEPWLNKKYLGELQMSPVEESLTRP